LTTAGLILYDLLKGTDVRRNLKFLKDSQKWSLVGLEKYQEDKLKHLLSSVQADVPYYRGLASGIRHPASGIISGIPSFPVIDRKDVMEAGERLLSDRINLKKCKVSRTGGTTGPPLRLYRDTETRSWALAAYYRFYEWMGIAPGMPEAELWGSTEIGNLKSIKNSKLKIQNYISRFRGYNAFHFNDAYLEAVVRDMQRFGPKLIRGYLSAILLLADHIKRNNIKGIRPLAVSCTAETLFPEYRKMIEEVFQAPLFDQYGCGECNSIAFECSEHNGMHITMEHCLLETDENNHFIVTNLDNHSQPFIRYRNGDTGIIDHSPCACGNHSPRIVQLHGRASENVILKDGASVNGIFFANLLDQGGFINSERMLRFQVVQQRAGEISFRAEVKPDAGNRGMKDADIKKLEDCLMPFFNIIEITQHAFLDPGPGGKFRYIISKIHGASRTG
jgi:phenylacetate-CoA ligase